MYKTFLMTKHLESEYYQTRDFQLKDDFYEKNYWNSIDPDGKLRNLENEKEKKLEECKEELSYINSLSPGNVLDVGCGLGFVLSGIDNNWNKYGIDISKWAVKRAERYGAIFCGNLIQANYESNFFDVVILLHVLSHLKNPIEVLIKIRHILKPNGKLIVTTPDYKCGVAKRFGNNFRLLHDRSHISLFNTLGLFRLLIDLEFNIERISYPFFDTIYFTKENLLRLFDVSEMSPPFYGNFVTIYSHKKIQGE